MDNKKFQGRNMLKLSLLLLLITGCVTTNTKPPKSKWKVLTNTSPASSTTAATKANYIPSGTELIFASAKPFTNKDAPINIKLISGKRCSLASSDPKKESVLGPNTVLTVVGYRAETDELVLSEPSYHQYLISCLSKMKLQKRKASSVSKSTIWKKATINMEDLQKMAPLLQIQFIPQ
jgi:hypothetical protein